MSKGDKIDIYVRGLAVPFNVAASQNGRKVEFDTEKGWAIASEITRGGTRIREVRVPVAEILSVDIVQKDIDG